MATETVKQKILQVVERLPDTAPIEDAIERLCFLAKVEEGFRQSDAGETVPHAEAVLLLSK
jgi:predicted transcriptional regulator